MTDQERSKPRRIVGTRLHDMDTLDRVRMREWCRHVLDYADAILIAADNSCYLPLCDKLGDYQSRVTILLVEPWLGFTHPLNTLVEKALFDGASELVLQSSEVWMEKSGIKAMSRHLGEDTLVVGARMSNTHADSTGVVPLTGLTSPWNTMALWNLDKLAKTGFLTVSGGLLAGVPGGMEEVVTISLLQYIDSNCLAKVLAVPGLYWAIDCMNAERKLLHEAKMKSKYPRAEQQLKYLGVPRGSVVIFST
uniref:Uncharacterized protein n=1 Tax=Candidatus Kentrum sp. LFY TaxID=2126342 RepID=A0A450WGE2_9GAMM|nr:MAG: hypothetical protein BECKLFY1418C_GA0070996_102032 [Candidatus Kentron sp. LFY]